MGGNIVIDKANGAVKASTNGGNVTVHLVAGADDPSSGQRHDVELISNGGNIELTVPKNFPMDVQVTLAYTKSATRAYRIEDNIGLTQHTSKDWDDSAGTPRKYIRAQGIAGNGFESCCHQDHQRRCDRQVGVASSLPIHDRPRRQPTSVSDR